MEQLEGCAPCIMSLRDWPCKSGGGLIGVKMGSGTKSKRGFNYPDAHGTLDELQKPFYAGFASVPQI